MLADLLLTLPPNSLGTKANLRNIFLLTNIEYIYRYCKTNFWFAGGQLLILLTITQVYLGIQGKVKPACPNSWDSEGPWSARRVSDPPRRIVEPQRPDPVAATDPQRLLLGVICLPLTSRLFPSRSWCALHEIRYSKLLFTHQATFLIRIGIIVMTISNLSAYLLLKFAPGCGLPSYLVQTPISFKGWFSSKPKHMQKTADDERETCLIPSPVNICIPCINWHSGQFVDPATIRATEVGGLAKKLVKVTFTLHPPKNFTLHPPAKKLTSCSVPPHHVLTQLFPGLTQCSVAQPLSLILSPSHLGTIAMKALYAQWHM